MSEEVSSQDAGNKLVRVADLGKQGGQSDCLLRTIFVGQDDRNFPNCIFGYARTDSGDLIVMF